MQRVFDIDVDPEFEIHTSYHNNFFIIRAKVLVNGKNAEIRPVKEDSYEEPALIFCYSGNTVSTKLWQITNTLLPIFHQCGIYHIDTFYYEQSPLFHVVFSSESCLKKFLSEIGDIEFAMETQLLLTFSERLKVMSTFKSKSSQSLAVKVQAELFLVVPNQQNLKGADLHSVTAKNCSNLMTNWKDSKLFDFASLYQEEAEPPKIISHPMSHKDILQGNPLGFTIKATGAEPLSYQWQWKPARKEEEQHEWQDLSCDGTTFQEVYGGLKLTGVQACHAGHYRCVVSNSVGSEISQCAGLTVTIVPDLIDLEDELQDVITWIPFGLYLGIKIGKLRAIERECSTVQECRIKMLEEWQNNVTPTWSAVVKALVGIGMRRNASELAEKHGIAPPKLPDDEPLEQLKHIPQQEEAIGSKLLKEAQKCTVNLEEDCKRLADMGERLTCSKKSKIAVNEIMCEIKSQLDEISENVRKIALEKKITAIELECKQQVCQRLSEIKEVNSTLLKETIKRNNEDIRILEKELERKESDIQSLEQEAQIREQELSQAHADLKMKCEEVQKIQQEYEKLTSCYDTEKERLSKIIQLLVADKVEMEQEKFGESQSESQQIEACNLNICQLTEVETLSSSLQKEGRAAPVQGELQIYQQASNTPEQLLESHTQTAQIDELGCSLQDTEHQKQEAESDRESAVQGEEAMPSFMKMLQLDEPPEVTNHPESLAEVGLGQVVSFTVQATGTHPLNYQWEWKSAGSKEWKPCNAEGSDGVKITIPSVQKSDEGQYRCVVSNIADNQKSKPARLEIKEWQPCNVEGSDDVKVTIPSVQKSDEGQYRCVVNNIAGSQKSKPARLELYSQSELQTPLKLTWRKGSSMMWEMTYYPKVVQLHHNLYMGGGGFRLNTSRRCTVHEYNSVSDEWNMLPEYDYYWFGMAVVDDQLTLVGGIGGGYTNEVGVWNPSDQEWTHPYPRMITPRSSPEVATYNNYLLAAGGYRYWYGPLTTVELLDIRTSKQWLTATQLPVPCSYMTSAIIQDYWYIITRSKEVMYTSLPHLCNSATDITPAQWHRLSDTPLGYSTTIALRGSLLAVGGRDIYDPSTAIHLYHPETDTWSKVGDLPIPREHCAVALLPGGEFLVSGGYSNYYRYRVDIATID